jgi:site-specific DNA recombinase
MNTNLITLQFQLLNDQITQQEYHLMKQIVGKNLLGLEVKLRDFIENKSPHKYYINQTVPMLENNLEYYRKSDGETKKKILSCIFSPV